MIADLIECLARWFAALCTYCRCTAERPVAVPLHFRRAAAEAKRRDKRNS